MPINREAMPSPHAEAAKALLEKIRALRAEIPRFVPEVQEETRLLVQKSLVPDPFMESASVSIQTFERLEQASGTDAATLRDAFGFALAYDPVVREVFDLARSMAHTIRVQRATAGESALDIYAFAQRLSKRKDGVELRPFVEDMRQKLKKAKRTRRANSTPTPAPVESTAKEPPTKV